MLRCALVSGGVLPSDATLDRRHSPCMAKQKICGRRTHEGTPCRNPLGCSVNHAAASTGSASDAASHGAAANDAVSGLRRIDPVVIDPAMMLQAPTDSSSRLADLRSDRDAELVRKGEAQARRDTARGTRGAPSREAEKAAIGDMFTCDAALSRIYQEVIEALPQAGLCFVLHEAYDGDGQDGESSDWKVPADALHSAARDWAMGNAFPPAYATLIANKALDAAVDLAERTVLFEAINEFEGTREEFPVPTLVLLVTQN